MFYTRVPNFVRVLNSLTFTRLISKQINIEWQKLQKKARNERKSITLTWNDLTVLAKQHHKSFIKTTKVTYKKLINNVSGYVESGNLVALMGPSGAGKSTLLYTLANRHTGSYLINGDIRLNGKKVGRSMCKVSGLMRQEDLFIGELTVKEHLMFMARLKLDRRISSEERESRVSALIKDLGLSHCSNNRIGGSTFGYRTKLSGGERKRLSFATACLTDPPLLFCDEPTTGLDSLNAIRLVSMMASWNGTILCTIHQPSPEILTYFSSIILIADGTIAFSGSIESGVDFFKSIGYEVSEDKTKGDFLLKCLVPSPGSEATMQLEVKRIAHQFALTEHAKATELYLEAHKISLHENENVSLKEHKSQFWIYKFFWLLVRALLESFKNPQIVWIKLGQQLIIALLSGFCYFGIVHKDQAGVQAMQGVLFTLVAENTFTNMYSELALFTKQLPLHLRELGDGDYHPSALYLAKILSTVPGLALEVTLFTVIVYFLADLKSTSYAFFMVLLCNMLCALVSAACGSMFGNIFSSYDQANIYLITFDNLILVTSGFYIKLKTLPVPLSWLQYLSWMMYTYESLTVIQWENVDNIECREEVQIPCLRNKDEVLEHYGFSEDSLQINLISMVVLWGCFHIISYIFFLRKIKKYK